MFCRQAGEVLWRRGRGSAAHDGGCSTGPRALGLADRGPGRAVPGAGGGPGPGHPAARGDTILAPGAAVDLLEVVEPHEAEPRAETGHGVPPRPGVGVLGRGGWDEGECDRTPPRIVGGEERQSDGATFVHGRSGTALGTTCAVGCGGARGAHGRQGSLAVRVRHVREECGALVCQRPPAPEHVTGGAPRGGRDGGLREPSAVEQGRHLWRVDLVMVGFAALDGLHGESMPEATRDPFVGTQVGQPVPGEPTRDGDHHPLSRRSHGFEEGLRVGFPRAMHEERAALVEEADVHHTGVQVDAAVKWVRCGVQSP